MCQCLLRLKTQLTIVIIRLLRVDSHVKFVNETPKCNLFVTDCDPIKLEIRAERERGKQILDKIKNIDHIFIGCINCNHFSFNINM